MTGNVKWPSIIHPSSPPPKNQKPVEKGLQRMSKPNENLEYGNKFLTGIATAPNGQQQVIIVERVTQVRAAIVADGGNRCLLCKSDIRHGAFVCRECQKKASTAMKLMKLFLK